MKFVLAVRGFEISPTERVERKVLRNVKKTEEDRGAKRTRGGE